MGQGLSGVGTVSDFLLELRCEEIPARMQAGARADLEKLLRKELDAAGIALGDLTVWSTPRRLTLIARGLPTVTAAVSEELKGPRVGAPPQALEGFLRKTGLGEDQLIERGGVLYAVTEKPGRATADVLAEAIPAIVRAFPWPKSQRWGAASLASESLRWVRPLSGIVALFDDAVIECGIGGIASGRNTAGHRFHAQGEVVIERIDQYLSRLHQAHVVVDHEERQDMIRDLAHKAADAAGLKLVEDEGLVIENAGLTEWPVPLLGRFDEAFLDVPPEVIQLTARTNQKYFVCNDAAGKLANAFVCTANIAASDGGAAIVDGNRKVLAARLSDARFFWEQDRKKTLAQHAEGLARITFHEKLGTVADKAQRVAKLARWLVEEGIVGSHSPATDPRHSREGGNPGADQHWAPAFAGVTKEEAGVTQEEVGVTTQELADQAELAAQLCKADLVTEMVGEFPELQGLMGGYYARAEGLPDAVADAIRDHYKPVGQGDIVPVAPVTVAVSLADKLDTIIEFFAIDERPTGSKDPFALRRATLGAIRTVLTNKLKLRLASVVSNQTINRAMATSAHSLERQIVDFFADRLKVQERDAGVRHDIVDAVTVLVEEDDLVRLLARVHALQAFIGTDDGTNLLAAYKRAANILKKEEFEAGAVNSTPEPAEAALIAALDAAEPKAEAAIAGEDFTAAMAALASLRGPIDVFFEAVMVNDPDPAKRAFRLGLLARFRAAVHKVADFSRIEG
ncbi:MAG: glycine--tRNA ligase subunit beta [Novosphingobium sp.]|uniref:glycine--tRNA ligase subunit beta n=1 Tax=Novosphingobium sp. TaxID=1874826 RepID=UPI0032BBDC27